jgi:cobalt-zinc-cadmium efflux system protein
MVGGGGEGSQSCFVRKVHSRAFSQRRGRAARKWAGYVPVMTIRTQPCAATRVRVESILMNTHHDDAHTHSHAGEPGHSHGLHGHSHAIGGRMTGVLGVAVVATLALVAVEVVAGYAAHSIALVSDAAHNLTDVPTLVISWLATRLAMRPPTAEKTYGYRRAGILAAFVNAMLVSFVALFVILESLNRLRHPVEVQAGIMMWVSAVALVVNGGITLAVHSGRSDLNVRTVWIHNLGDALSNIAVFGAALTIRWTKAEWADPAIGILIGAMVLWAGIGILRQSSHILLEGMPSNLRLEEVAAAMLRVENVMEVHDIHIWTVGTDLNALSCHIRIPDMHMEESERILTQLRETLARDFHITHTTVQFERAGLPAEAGPYMPEPARRSAR